jgi:hypothetical protein
VGGGIDGAACTAEVTALGQQRWQGAAFFFSSFCFLPLSSSDPILPLISSFLSFLPWFFSFFPAAPLSSSSLFCLCLSPRPWLLLTSFFFFFS